MLNTQTYILTYSTYQDNQFKNSAILKSTDGGYSWFSLAYDSLSAFLGPFKSDNDYLIIRNNDKLILSCDCFESYEEIQIPNEISSEMYFIGYGGFSGTIPINQDTLNAFEFFKYSVVENKFITGSVIYDYKIPHPLVSYIILDNNDHVFHISYKTYEIDGKEYRNIISFYHSSVDEQRYECTAEDSSYWYSYHLFGISEEIQINVAGSRLYYSIDKGKSWNNVQYDCIDCSYPLFNTLSYYISPSRVYFVTTDGLYYLEKGQLMSFNNETIITKSEIFISPNPATDYIVVDIPPPERGLGGVSRVVKVFNVLGVEVMTASIHPTTQSHRMNIESLPPGMYFVQSGSRVQRFVKM